MADYNFSNCIFDITKFGEGVKIQDVYPQLLSYPDVLEYPEIAQKIGICMADMGSPFVSIKDHKYKIESIFSFIEKIYDTIDFSDETWLEVKHKILDYSDCPTMDMCTFILEYQNHHEFTSWFDNNLLYYTLSKRKRIPMADGENEDKYYDRVFKTQSRVDELGVKLKEQEAMLFGSEAMKIAAFRSKKKRITTYAEKYAIPNQVE